ncbi:ATP-binding cassette domain-containing protein [Salidesulfovibrio onnuriiensis]|uniref:ATP-binding cassette domain-containing protein n=1 Tax=Salidesulfovibrio onnuriiensis TaxID=2583823 RepID=UPI0011C9996F|nr:ATP-binding cassette domain-containing protein [Salidesulfovibrio onnuriiensis]
MSAPFLEIRDLHVHAAGKELISGISFEASQGRVMGLVGASGSGKSLTCLSVLDLLPKGLGMQGDIRVEGLPLQDRESRRDVRSRKIGMILQNPMSCFDPVFTIRTHFKETLSAHGLLASDSMDRMLNALEEVGFADPRPVPDLYPFQMSGGMLQRVMVALALILEAPFLIADEPTTDLDTVAQARVLDLLAGLKQNRGLGMLLVTHDLGVIARLADDVAVMHDGRIIERGTVHDIFRTPRHEYTRNLIATHLRISGYQ